MKFILPLLLLFSFSAYSQSADFILLKKKSKTMRTIYAGNDIAFTTVSGAFINAHINGIKNDSLFLQEYIIRYLPTTISTYVLDTAGSYRYQFHYNQIKALGRLKKRKGFDRQSSGASLFGGGLVLTVASGIVYLADRKKFSAPLLIASATLGTLGYLWAKSGGNAQVIGKKYTLAYMDMSNKKP
jgi:hypothetical protein